MVSEEVPSPVISQEAPPQATKGEDNAKPEPEHNHEDCTHGTCEEHTKALRLSKQLGEQSEVQETQDDPDQTVRERQFRTSEHKAEQLALSVARQQLEKGVMPFGIPLNIDGKVPAFIILGQKGRMLQLPEDIKKGAAALMKQKMQILLEDSPSEYIFNALSVDTIDLAALQQLLEKYDVDINDQDCDGNCMLHWSAWNKHPDITEWLLEQGCKLDTINGLEQTPLHWACMGGGIKSLRLLMERGADPNLADVDGYISIHAAAQFGQTMVLEFLLCYDKSTAVESATIDVNAVDSEGRTALHWAAYKALPRVCAWLFHNNATLDAKDIKNAQTALHMAAKHKHHAVLKVLLEHASPEQVALKDKFNKTALEIATEMKAHMCVKLLRDSQKDSRDADSFVAGMIEKFNDLGTSGGRIIGSCFHLMHTMVLVSLCAMFIPKANEAAGTCSDESLVNKVGCCGEDGALCLDTNTWTDGAMDPGHWIVFLIIFVVVQIPIYWFTNLVDPGTVKEGDTLKDGRGYQDLLMEGKADYICVTTKTVKPPRSKYCVVNKKVIRKFDHYCPWVNNTIGCGNYKPFLLFTLLEFSTCIFWFVGVIIYLTSMEPAAGDYVWLILLLLPTSVVMLFSGALFATHVHLISVNLTTNESINKYRYNYLKDATGAFYNPYDAGCCGNWLAFLKCGEEDYLTPLEPQNEETSGHMLRKSSERRATSGTTTSATLRAELQKEAAEVEMIELVDAGPALKVEPAATEALAQHNEGEPVDTEPAPTEAPTSALEELPEAMTAEFSSDEPAEPKRDTNPERQPPSLPDTPMVPRSAKQVNSEHIVLTID